MRRSSGLVAMSAVMLASVVQVVADEAKTAESKESIQLNGKEAPANGVWLDSLDVKLITQDWGKPKAGKSVDGNAMKIAGNVYPHGVGTHALSEMNIELGGQAVRFMAMVGVDDETGKRGSVVFEAWVDDKKIQDSGVLRGGEAAKPFSVDLAGVKTLTLIVSDAGDGIDHDHADWAGAVILLKPGATTKPRAVASSADEPAIKIASGSPEEPRINGARIVGTTPGRPFVFGIPATGKKPLAFSAKGLPAGLQLDPATGVITGAVGPDAAGKHVVQLQVEGPAGKARRELTIVAGEHKLALTPPMGWNSWNVWACAVTDAKIREAADAMVASGLAAHGFQYINIDDCWQAGRDANGEIQTNERFPDMKALGDYIHSKGLRFGVYSSPGTKTCAGYTASWEHEEQDARTWAKWGVDYIKHDWCSYGEIAKPLFEKAKAQAAGDEKKLAELNLEIYQKPYQAMRTALDNSGRDIVYSLCQYGMGDVWKWGADVGGNLWRTTGDINDSWQSMAGIGFRQDSCAPYAQPGHWNDPDMLVVGRVGWGPSLHETKLTKNEQITHITLWSLLAAPLLIGCDMTNMDPFTVDLLSNDEVLAVDQDLLGKAATRKSQQDQAEVWARPLFDGTQAVGLFNRGRKATQVIVKWSYLGLSGEQPVRDLWQQKDLGKHADKFTVEVPRHGAVLIKVGAAHKE